ncbi:hypothetical protein CG477_022550 (plasmid) [Bacillus cytotoxicus]|uniref:TnsD family Tn7-like transposition protein n=1 Tax=Bacillus cytotoxicus TaxID=580165 RepID=UPI000D66096E|nr:TnsD family Tn7-like transposition protein [Bacillus cytotoxicus]AWC55095.1 hypothetical protein CG477_022550 [Bacillus cytotoxicus]
MHILARLNALVALFTLEKVDRLSEDKYRIGRIKAFGDVWKAKLRELEAEGTYSTRTLAKMLGVDSKTVKKISLFRDENRGIIRKGYSSNVAN